MEFQTVLPKDGSKPEAIVILLHGYGSNKDDLIGLVPHLQPALPKTVFVSPNAPFSMDGMFGAGGYQWFPLRDLSKSEVDSGVAMASKYLQEFIDRQLGTYDLKADKMALVGFSQGTMMAMHVGLRLPTAPAAIVGYSGMLANPESLNVEGKTKPPVLLVHGDADTVVPYSALAAAEAALKAYGCSVEAVTCHGLGHGIDGEGLAEGRDFLGQTCCLKTSLHIQ